MTVFNDTLSRSDGAHRVKPRSSPAARRFASLAGRATAPGDGLSDHNGKAVLGQRKIDMTFSGLPFSEAMTKHQLGFHGSKQGPR